MQRHQVVFHDGLPDRLADFGLVERTQVGSLYLLDHHHLFIAIDIHAEGGARTGDQALVAGASRLLNVTGVVIPSANNDQVL